MAQRIIGTVKWWNSSKGFGFFEQPNGPDVFAHFAELKMDGFKNLTEGQQVEFSIEKGAKGLQATNITPVNQEKKSPIQLPIQESPIFPTTQAHLAIQSAKERFGKSLSFSENSLPDLEGMLNYAISEISKYKADNKPTDKMIERTGEVWGSFLGEVMIHELGGSWLVSNQDTLFLLIDGVVVDPIKYISKRMTGQASNSVLQFYSAVKEKIDLSRKNLPKTPYLDTPPISNFTRESASTIGIGQIILHLILILITGGAWLFVLMVWALVSLINRK